MLHVKESSTYGDRLRTNFFLDGLSRLLGGWLKQLPSNLDRWRLPGSMKDEASDEASDEEQI